MAIRKPILQSFPIAGPKNIQQSIPKPKQKQVGVSGFPQSVASPSDLRSKAPISSIPISSIDRTKVSEDLPSIATGQTDAVKRNITNLKAASTPLLPKTDAVVKPLAIKAAGLEVTPTPTPEVVTPPSKVPQLRDLLLGTLAPSDREGKLQGQLDALLSGLESGTISLAGQGRGIPTSLVRGQQQKLLEQETLRAAPIQRELARLLAQRTGEQTVATKALEFETADELARAKAAEPITVGEGTSLIDPITKQIIFQKDKQLSVADAKALGLPFGTTQNEATELGIIPVGSDAANFDIRSVGGQIIRVDKSTGETEVIFEGEEGEDPFTTQQRFQNTFGFRKDFLDESKDFKAVRDSFSRIEASAEDPSAAGDVAVVFNFMKMLDPGSVVRESEFALAANTGSLKDALKNKFGKLATGEILTFTREDFIARAEKLFNAQIDIQRSRQDENRSTASELGLDPILAVPDLIGGEEEAGIDLSTLQLNQSFNNVDDLIASQPEFQPLIDSIIQEQPNISDQELLAEIDAVLNFSQVGSDTNAAGITLGSRLAKANNNPGNLRFANQTGASQGEGGFASFPTPQAGVQALKNQIILDASRGLTLKQFVFKFAPPNENDSQLYLKQMKSATGSKDSTLLNNINLDQLAKAMAKKESSSIIT